MPLYLIRHGEDANPAPGHLTNEDVPLNETGRQQARECALRLRAALGDHASQVKILASPRLRTMQTARIIAETIGVDDKNIQADARLAERDCTAYAGKLASDVFSLSEESLVRGGMEPYEHLCNRLNAVCQELQQGANHPVLLITHSGNIPPFLHILQQPTTEPTAHLSPSSYIQCSLEQNDDNN